MFNINDIKPDNKMNFNAKEIWMLVQDNCFKEVNKDYASCTKDNCPFFKECRIEEDREMCLICSVLGFVEEIASKE